MRVFRRRSKSSWDKPASNRVASWRERRWTTVSATTVSVNPKLITWDGEIRTGFRGTSRDPRDIRSCYATGVLKIGSVYQRVSNYHLQVFLKECKYREREVIFKSLLSDDEDEGYDTAHWRVRKNICEGAIHHKSKYAGGGSNLTWHWQVWYRKWRRFLLKKPACLLLDLASNIPAQIIYMIIIKTTCGLIYMIII